MSGKEIQRWADEAMFASERHSDIHSGPKVYLLGAPVDPLGHIAACAKMYVGEVVRDLRDVTDEERKRYLVEMQKTKLKMPLESVSLHFMFEDVTRAFTHQLVRQRTAAYAQESMRFAVVEDMNDAVALPPSLARYTDAEARAESLQRKAIEGKHAIPRDEVERHFWVWHDAVETISAHYGNLVETGMPAEDARGLMPTNIVTRVNYITNFRGLLDHSGNRLCTQAQFEWRLVFARIAEAMRKWGASNSYAHRENGEITYSGSAWQWDAIADLLRPVCYQTGSCAFQADFDRKCNIRQRVEAFGHYSVKPEHWGEDLYDGAGDPGDSGLLVKAIDPREWLANPGAAR